jgi:hypothetical protein
VAAGVPEGVVTELLPPQEAMSRRRVVTAANVILSEMGLRLARKVVGAVVEVVLRLV